MTPFRRPRGFTLIEIMVTVAIVAIIASVALPNYTAYIQRSRVGPALDALASFTVKMEQAYQDSGRYSKTDGTCVSTLGSANNFTLSCSISNAGQAYTATATGTGQMSGYVYTINNSGERRTTSHPKGANATCWSVKGTACDT